MMICPTVVSRVEAREARSMGSMAALTLAHLAKMEPVQIRETETVVPIIDTTNVKTLGDAIEAPKGDKQIKALETSETPKEEIPSYVPEFKLTNDDMAAMLKNPSLFEQWMEKLTKNESLKPKPEEPPMWTGDKIPKADRASIKRLAAEDPITREAVKSIIQGHYNRTVKNLAEKSFEQLLEEVKAHNEIYQLNYTEPPAWTEKTKAIFRLGAACSPKVALQLAFMPPKLPAKQSGTGVWMHSEEYALRDARFNPAMLTPEDAKALGVDFTQTSNEEDTLLVDWDFKTHHPKFGELEKIEQPIKWRELDEEKTRTFYKQYPKRYLAFIDSSRRYDDSETHLEARRERMQHEICRYIVENPHEYEIGYVYKTYLKVTQFIFGQ